MPYIGICMRWPIVISAVIIVIGVGLIGYAMTLPFYRDPDLPMRLAIELQDAPRETRFREWYSRLASCETPRKKLSDWGRGLVAAGAGTLFAASVWSFYQSVPPIRTFRAGLLVWIGLWLGRIPFSMWYYDVRTERFEYPPWGDSTAIPFVGEALLWIIGAAGSSVLLTLFVVGHQLPDNLRPARPSSPLGWVRTALLVCWMMLLCWGVLSGIPDGDEGMVFSSIGASIVILALLAAPPTVRIRSGRAFRHPRSG